MARPSISFIVCVMFIIVNLQKPCAGNPYLFAKDAYDYAVKIYNGVQSVQKAIDGSKENNDREIRIDDGVLKLSTDFNEFKTEILNKISTNLRSKLDVKTDDLFKVMRDINFHYNNMIDILQNYNSRAQYRIENFANVATADDLHSPSRKVAELHEIFAGKDYKDNSIMKILIKDAKAGDTMCIKGQSSQQLIMDLFQLVVYTDSKYLVTAFYGNDLKKKFEKDEKNIGNYAYEKENEIRKFNSRIGETYDKVKAHLTEASREIWKCDPDNHEAGETYTKPWDVFQGYVHREQDLFRDEYFSLHSCDFYRYEREFCVTKDCKDIKYKNQLCPGVLRDCEDLGKKNEICFAESYSTRKYKYLIADGTKYGREERCEKKSINDEDLIKGLYSVCFCTCESGERLEDRYFSLRPVTSDTANNKIVTGVKFQVENHIFQIQIQEGQVGEKGTIIGEPEWKELYQYPDFYVMSKNVSEQKFEWLESKESKLDVPKQVSTTTFLKNDEVYPITWDSRTIFLDDLLLPADQLLTGLRFARVEDNLRLEIRGTVFDYTTGQLDQTKNKWYSNSAKKDSRQQVDLKDLDDPSLHPGSDKFSKKESFVEFTTTGKRVDASQNTIPFIDIQEVTSGAIGEKQYMPLVGAGIFHKRTELSGGFLALKIFHYDFSRHM